MSSPNIGFTPTSTSNTPGSVPATEPHWSEDGMGEDVERRSIGEQAMYRKTDHAGPIPVSNLEQVEYGSWQGAPNSRCHASFGDQATTATVGAFGQLLQFSKFLGAGSSGMFSVDHMSVSEPYLVTSRANQLHELSQQPFHFGPAVHSDQQFGLRFPGLVLKPKAEPQLKWTHWRWPRHEYPQGHFKGFPRLKLTIQWMVHDNVVLQQCLLEYDGKESINVDVEFSKSMIIRDLDHLDSSFDFNQRTANHDISPGRPGGYSWNLMREFNSKSTEDTKTKDSVRNTSPNIQSCRSRFRMKRRFQPGQTSPDLEERSKSSHGVSVTTTVAFDGQSQVFESTTPQSQRWQHSLPGSSNTDGQVQTLEVTVAYRMDILGTSNIDWKTHVIPWDDMRVDEFLRKQRLATPLPLCSLMPLEEYLPHMAQTMEEISSNLRIKGSGDTTLAKHDESNDTTRTQTHYILRNPVGTPGKTSPQHKSDDVYSYLEFASRRNLEHILSVCAVQTTSQTHDSTVSSATSTDLGDVKAVALTCGDMSGHRICWSASFFAFRFLISVYKTLDRLPKDPDVKSVLHRISRTCRGHLKWLHLAQGQDSGQRFGPNYWVTGELMNKPKRSGSWVAGESLLDTGFQILKAADCMELWPEDNFGAKMMSEWAPSWLIAMEDSDKRKKYAWPHAEYEGVNTFRLDDHVWIWRALKSLEQDDHQAWHLMSEKISDYSLKRPSKLDLVRLRKTFASDVFQREVSKRFTTRNDVLQKRMLAVSRSPRETRFLLHSRDTALFYKEMFNFFENDASLQELWRGTLGCQTYHDENQESSWEVNLRHALCIVMGTRDHKINNESPHELVRMATIVLLRSSSPNGLFPGRLRPSFNQSLANLFSAESERDSYYHASFEIPYVLLTHAERVSDAFAKLSSPTNIARTPEHRPNTRSRDAIHPPGMSSILQSSQLKDEISLSPDDADQRQRLLCLSNLLFSQSKTAFHDHHETSSDARQAAKQQQWTMKKSLPFNNLIDSSNIVKLEDEWMFNYPDCFMRETPLEWGDYEQAQKEFEDALNHLNTSSEQPASIGHWKRNFRCYITDVPSKKLMGDKDSNPTYHISLDDMDLRRSLSPVRKAESAKKRLFYFPSATKEAASICFAATELSERENMRVFFERHLRYEKHSADQCSMIQNSWESEFHLSYYQLVETPTISHGIPQPEVARIPGGQRKYLARTSVSFRFQGDFFDRFWTCYMLEYAQQGRVMDPGIFTGKEYRQRKFLEQHCFSGILKSLTRSMGDILAEVKDCLGFQRGSFSISIPSNTAYTSWSAVWREFEPLVKALEDDLVSTQITIDQWESREEDRGKEQPRWTRNDERKHRASITRVRRDIKREKDKLKHLQANVKLLRESYSDGLVKAREELSFRSEQNIATFTYVTVVFLPLGFTASIFSMNGSPGKSLAVNMVVASVIALAVTILALMNATSLAVIAENITTSFKDITAKAKQSSVMMRDREIAETEPDQSNPGDHKPPRLHVSSTDANLWNLAFWTCYIFIELPSRCIAAACRTIVWVRDYDKDLEGLKKSKSIGPLARSALASGLRYTLVPGMVYSDKHVALVLGRSSMGLPRGHIAHLVADGQLRKVGYPTRIARVLLGFFTIPIFLPTWILQIVCFNAWDALALLGGELL